MSDQLQMDYECPTHGHRLTRARDPTGVIRGLGYALQNKGEVYACPNRRCEIQVFPEPPTPVRGLNRLRMGHFNAKSTSRETRKPRQNDSTLTELLHDSREAIAAALTDSQDFDFVGIEMDYSSFIPKEGEWWPRRQFNASIFARRGGNDSIDAILHLMVLGRTNVNELYQNLKEVAGEPSPSQKRRHVSKGDVRFDLAKRVYQNIIVIQDPRSFDVQEDGRVMLPPNVYGFVNFMCPSNTWYYDPTNFEIQRVEFSDPQDVESKHVHEYRRTYAAAVTPVPNFTLVGEELGRFQREFENSTPQYRYSVNIPNWKLATPVAIDLDKNGNPTTVRSNNQVELIFPETRAQ